MILILLKLCNHFKFSDAFPSNLNSSWHSQAHLQSRAKDAREWRRLGPTKKDPKTQVTRKGHTDATTRTSPMADILCFFMEKRLWRIFFVYGACERGPAAPDPPKAAPISVCKSRQRHRLRGTSSTWRAKGCNHQRLQITATSPPEGYQQHLARRRLPPPEGYPQHLPRQRLQPARWRNVNLTRGVPNVEPTS